MAPKLYRYCKLVDLLLQFLVPVVYARLTSRGYGINEMLLVHVMLGLGTAQILSCLLWLGATPKGRMRAGRRRYGWLLLAVVVVCGGLLLLAGLDSDSGILALLILLVAGPSLGLWYFILTVNEALEKPAPIPTASPAIK